MAKRGRKPGFKLSEETKQKIAKSITGRKHSEETKRKMSESKKGIPSPFKGHYKPYDFGIAVSKAKKGKPLSEEHKEAMRGVPKTGGSHRKGKKWLDVDGTRVWFTQQEYADFIAENPDYKAWGEQRTGMTWRVVDGKRTWMTKEEAEAFDLQ